jgi:hypothetical protein
VWFLLDPKLVSLAAKLASCSIGCAPAAPNLGHGTRMVSGNWDEDAYTPGFNIL